MISKPVSSVALAAIGGSALLCAAMAVSAVPAAPTDAGRGGRLFLQCAACHAVTADGADAVGPNLAGVVGRRAGAKPGYQYSAALAKSGLVWNTTTLDAFLKRPSQAVPGTKMTFGGVADPRSRADLIAYLATLRGRK